ncbi:hypothetical protein LDENG_00031100 [Lucifuga dentata]|nr:hypothetical protein LDENG_00031100 [Lucifuga dentata]
MRKALLKMMGVLLCALAAYADIQPVKDFNLEKMTGKWYLVGLATNAEWFVNEKATNKMGTVMMEQTAEGNLNMSHANLKDNGTCWRMNNLANKTDTPGRFTFYNQVWNDDNDIRFVDVVYDDYALVYIIKTTNGVSEVLNKLYRRSSEVSAALKEMFTEFSLKNGVLADNIVFPPPNAECPEA